MVKRSTTKISSEKPILQPDSTQNQPIDSAESQLGASGNLEGKPACVVSYDWEAVRKARSVYGATNGEVLYSVPAETMKNLVEAAVRASANLRSAGMATIDRRKFIGSSDIAAVLGISPWKTPYQLWQEKTSQEPLPERDTPLLRMGQYMEGYIIDEATTVDGLFVRARNTRLGDLAENYDFLSCQLDFEYMRDDAPGGLFGIGECKFITFAHDQWGESGTEDCPEYYKAQVYFQMALTGYDEATIYALINGELRWYRFYRDPELCQELIDRAVDFWQHHVLTGIPPEIQTKEDAADSVSRFGGWALPADEGLLKDLAELRTAKSNLSSYKKDADVLEERIIRKIALAAQANQRPDEEGRVSVLDDAGHKLISWNLQKRKGYYVEPTEYRVLRIHGVKE
jgi:putative phage-type endonuclease